MFTLYNLQEIDIGLGPFSVSADRFKAIDYLFPITQESFVMVMKKPTSNIADSVLLVTKPYKCRLLLQLSAKIYLN